LLLKNKINNLLLNVTTKSSIALAMGIGRRCQVRHLPPTYLWILNIKIKTEKREIKW
jgi:hypothetical protein